MSGKSNNNSTPGFVSVPLSKRFQLPALDFKFGALTDGTDIPPPLPSPIAEEPEELSEKLLPTAPNGAAANGTPATATDAPKPLHKRGPDESPLSPTYSQRQGSIRRLFSRSVLNNGSYNSTFNNGEISEFGASPTSPNNASSQYSRPPSRSGSMFGGGGDRTARRTTSWFRRLRGPDGGDRASVYGADGRRLSRAFGAEQTASQANSLVSPKGPPPPSIPEFSKMGSKVNVNEDAGTLGDDLFGNIR